FNTLLKKGLGRPSIDPALETLFARGIDPDGPASNRSSATGWPDRSVVQQFAAEADRQVLEALAHGDVDQPGHPLLDRAEAVFSILEHEAMHQETLLYMWHRLPINEKKKPAGYQPRILGASPRVELINVPAGRAMLGLDREAIAFGWDTE